jgi:hypothetical protein
MRDLPGYGGKCAVLDSGPSLFVENVLAVDIFNAAKLSGEVRDIKLTSDTHKTLVYLKPADVEALMNIYGVPKQERIKMFVKVQALQGVDHEVAPPRSNR